MNWSLVSRVAVGIVLAVLLVGSWLADGSPNMGLLKFLSVAGTTVFAAFLLWEHWAWRLPLVQMLPKVPRNIRGTWRGVLKSQWIDPQTGKQIPEKTVYLVVRQNASTVRTALYTNESRSTSSLAKVSDFDGDSILHYLYFNKPSIGVESRSRMHHGSTALDVAGSPAKRLAGRYWTDRDSKGELVFTERSKVLVDDYEGAVALWP